MDPNDLIPLLSKLGPWGLAAAAFLMWWRGRSPAVPPVPPVPDPVKPPAPAPAPVVPVPSNTPLLDAILAAIRQRLAPQLAPPRIESYPAAEDIDPQTAAELLGKLCGKK